MFVEELVERHLRTNPLDKYSVLHLLRITTDAEPAQYCKYTSPQEKWSVIRILDPQIKEESVIRILDPRILITDFSVEKWGLSNCNSV